MVTTETERHLIKRYGGARLYDTTALAYVDAGQVRALVGAGGGTTVVDAVTGEDVTASVAGD